MRYFAVVLLAAVAACGNGPTPPEPAPVDLSGMWTGTMTVVAEPDEPDPITLPVASHHDRRPHGSLLSWRALHLPCADEVGESAYFFA